MSQRFLVLLLVFSSFGMSACRTAGDAIEAYGEVHPKLFVVITTEDLAKDESVVGFLDFKRRQGFQVVAFATKRGGIKAARFAKIRESLAAIRPKPGSLGYALIIGAPRDFSMGPWGFEGIEGRIDSDLPYFLQAPIGLGDTISEAAWEQALEKDFPWVFGRIPYSRPTKVAGILESTRRFDRPGRERPRALFGAERWALWWDSSLIMSRAKKSAEIHGWEAILLGEDAPCDLSILGKAPTQEESESALIFLNKWRSFAPQFVYTLSHGSPVGIGDSLVPSNAFLSTETEEIVLAKGWSTNGVPAVVLEYPERPRSPAILFATGCSSGTPTSGVVSRLFEGGWICGFGGFVAPSTPLPLSTALNAEVNSAEVVASGLPVGLALRAARETYWEAARASLSYWLLDLVRRKAAMNVLGSVYYGDPSLQVKAGAGVGDQVP